MKHTELDNYRVEAEPCQPFYRHSHKQLLRECEDLRDSIKRHCDVENIYIEFDTTHTCSFCGCLWESCFDGDEIMCCNLAQIEQDTVLAICNWANSLG